METEVDFLDVTADFWFLNLLISTYLFHFALKSEV